MFFNCCLFAMKSRFSIKCHIYITTASDNNVLNMCFVNSYLNLFTFRKAYTIPHSVNEVRYGYIMKCLLFHRFYINFYLQQISTLSIYLSLYIEIPMCYSLSLSLSPHLNLLNLTYIFNGILSRGWSDRSSSLQ